VYAYTYTVFLYTILLGGFYNDVAVLFQGGDQLKVSTQATKSVYFASVEFEHVRRAVQMFRTACI